MKKEVWSFLLSYMIFFALCAFVVTCSFLLFFFGIELSEEQVRAMAPLTFGNVALISFLLVCGNQIWKKITVDRQVQTIKSSLEQIMDGDFSVRLDSKGSQANFREIMESINRMTEELSGVETLRTDFISNVSHELKTPLSVIQNYGMLLQSPELSEEKRLEYARAITEASRRLADLITNILKLNRLENQQIYPAATEYNLGEQLCECLLQFETQWEQKQIQISTDIAEDVLVKADRELLYLVWNNLFSNAFKFTEPGGTVTVGLKCQEDCALVLVEDTGCGMSPEVGAHIFEKFYQGDTSHASQGNGLGLPLVKRIIDIIGGEISVSSTPGVGSRFLVKIDRG